MAGHQVLLQQHQAASLALRNVLEAKIQQRQFEKLAGRQRGRQNHAGAYGDRQVFQHARQQGGFAGAHGAGQHHQPFAVDDGVGQPGQRLAMLPGHEQDRGIGRQPERVFS